jgi:hypothetical protein
MNTFKKYWHPIYRSHRGISIIICKITVVLMMGCLGFGFAQMAKRFAFEIGSSYFPSYLTFLAVFISAEAMYTQHRATDLEGREKFIFRAAEGLTILILFKLFILLRIGPTAMVAEISKWQTDFFGSFFSGELISGGFILILVWMISTQLSSDIDDLHDREQDSTWDELGLVQNALKSIRSRITAFVFAAGALVLFFSVGARLNLQGYIPILKGHFDPSVPIANVLLYFVLTLILLSQTQFALLRTRWLWSKTPVASRLARNWLIYGIIFFAGLAVLSFLLPTNYSLGFFATLGYALNLLGIAFRFLIAVILIPLSLCAKLFNISTGQPQGEDISPAPPPPPLQADGSPSALWQFIQSLLFWGTLLAVVIFALSQYIKANAFLFRRIAQIPFIRWFSNIAQYIWSWLIGANKTIVTIVSAGLRRLRPPSAAFNRLDRILRRPGGLTPREQVIEIYLTLLELGQKIGPARRNAETPYQYSRNIIGVHPDVSNEVMDITEAFTEARYSSHPIQAETVPTLRKKWEHLRENLRRDESTNSVEKDTQE